VLFVVTLSGPPLPFAVLCVQVMLLERGSMPSLGAERIFERQ
jgi:hypothetical protein